MKDEIYDAYDYDDSGPHGGAVAWCAIAFVALVVICCINYATRHDKRPAAAPVDVCEVSYYAAPEHGQRTACGEVFDSTKLTCASIDTIPFGALVLFVNGTDSVVCRVTDRMPSCYREQFPARLFDLSAAAFCSLGVGKELGVADVEWRVWK